MSAHILDRPVWSALSTRQTAWSRGGERARCFVTEVGPLAGARDDEPESLAELAGLVPEAGVLLLLQAAPIVLPPGTVVRTTAEGVQMIAERVAEVEGHAEAVRLGAEHNEAMVALATLTKPGPFASRTSQLGQFWGVVEGGELLAMAGERMRQPGFTEVSGVCVHPKARGRGLARALSALVARAIFARGETPYLHAYATNTAAITLYESLGFRLRCRMHVAAIARGAKARSAG